MGNITELYPEDRDGDQDIFVSASARDRSPIVGSGKGVERLNQ